METVSPAAEAREGAAEGPYSSGACMTLLQSVAAFEATEISGVADSCIRAGVPTHIETQWFYGTVMLFVRDPLEPVNTPGLFNKRYWEMQVQGRFKKTSEHFVMGMEVSEVLRPSLVLRGLTTSLLSFVRSFEPDIHFSFGSAKGGIAMEMPHLVSPQFKGCDYIVETPDGETPPPLGTDITGGTTHAKGGRPTAARLDCVYTFCCFSTCIDLTAWKLSGTPMGSIDVAKFIGREAAIRIVMYTLAGRSALPRASHAITDKASVLCVQFDPPHLRRAISRPPSDASGTESAVACAVDARDNADGGGSFRERRTLSESISDAAAAASDALAELTGSKPAKKKRRKKRTAPARPPAAVPTAQPSPARPRAETPPAPPLFRAAIAITADGGRPDGLVHEGSPTESELAAQQRLLMWMAGTPPKKIRRSSRRAASEGAPRWRISRLLAWLARRRRPKSPPRASAGSCESVTLASGPTMRRDALRRDAWMNSLPTTCTPSTSTSTPSSSRMRPPESPYPNSADVTAATPIARPT